MTYNNWMKVWWTNRQPRLIVSYYIEAARKLGGTFIRRIICYGLTHIAFPL
jgi:hypothetical protein